MLEIIVKKYDHPKLSVAMLDLEENDMPNIDLRRVPALHLYSLK
jgi:hypothetical protein